MQEYQIHFMDDIVSILGYFNIPLDVRYFIAAQFALESSFGRSSLAVDNNNYCGMKNPLVRLSLATHSGDALYHWASYPCLSDCVTDYLLCLQYHRPLSCDYDTVKHFTHFISKFYCPEKDYISRITSIYQQFKSLKNGKS